MQPRILVTESHDLLQACAIEACQRCGVSAVVAPAVMDSSGYLHDEASLLDAAELAEAEAALVEDGVFTSSDWRERTGTEDGEREVLLRAAIKYGWALAHLAHASAEVSEGEIIWSVADGATPTTEAELTFLRKELHTRGLRVRWISLCLPVALEPLCDLEQDRVPILCESLAGSARVIRGSALGLFIPNAVEKLSILPRVAEQFGSEALLGFAGIGGCEAARLIARADPELFRAWLARAQEHFPFDKGRLPLSTTEDDVHALPDVSDSELERVFIGDFRGRQLLHVTFQSSLADQELLPRLEAVWSARRAELVDLVAERVSVHLAGLGS